jgi:hypothetical protein
MKRPGFRPILLLLLLPGLAHAQTRERTPYPAMAAVERYRIADPQEEIALARTAAPRSISADAEVLVLGKHGYASTIRWILYLLLLAVRSSRSKKYSIGALPPAAVDAFESFDLDRSEKDSLLYETARSGCD